MTEKELFGEKGARPLFPRNRKKLLKRRAFMNFIDFIILAIVLVTLGLIAYHNFIKKDKDVCSKCAYRRDNCDCGKKK